VVIKLQKMDIDGSRLGEDRYNRLQRNDNELNIIPVFVFPNHLLFRIWRRGQGPSGSLSQTIKLSNPYDFNIQYEGEFCICVCYLVVCICYVKVRQRLLKGACMGVGFLVPGGKEFWIMY